MTTVGHVLRTSLCSATVINRALMASSRRGQERNADASVAQGAERLSSPGARGTSSPDHHPARPVGRTAAHQSRVVSGRPFSRLPTTRVETLRRAKRLASRRTSLVRTAAAPSPMAASPRNGSATTAKRMRITARTGRSSTPATARSRAGTCRSSIPTPPPARGVSSRHGAPRGAGVVSTAGRTRRSSSVWPSASPNAPTCSSSVAPRLNIRSARSSSQ